MKSLWILKGFFWTNPVWQVGAGRKVVPWGRRTSVGWGVGGYLGHQDSMKALSCYTHGYITPHPQSFGPIWASNVLATSCACAFFMSVVLVVPWQIGICVLNQLTNHSVQFSSHSYTSVPGEMASIFNHFKSPYWSKKLKVSSLVVNLIKKMHTRISGKNICTETFPCIVQLVQNTEHMKCSVCFLGLFCQRHPWWTAQCRTTGQIQASHWQSKSVGKKLKIFHFMGCRTPSSHHLDIIWVETLFTNYQICL